MDSYPDHPSATLPELLSPSAMPTDSQAPRRRSGRPEGALRARLPVKLPFGWIATRQRGVGVVITALTQEGISLGSITVDEKHRTLHMGLEHPLTTLEPATSGYFWRRELYLQAVKQLNNHIRLVAHSSALSELATHPDSVLRRALAEVLSEAPLLPDRSAFDFIVRQLKRCAGPENIDVAAIRDLLLRSAALRWLSQSTNE